MLIEELSMRHAMETEIPLTEMLQLYTGHPHRADERLPLCSEPREDRVVTVRPIPPQTPATKGDIVENIGPKSVPATPVRRGSYIH